MAKMNYTPTKELPNSYQVLPAGTYVAAIVDSDMRVSKAGNDYLNLEWQIQGGPHDGRKVWQMVHAWNANETAARIGKQQLNQICDALGLDTTLTDSVQLHGVKLAVTVEVEDKDDGYPAKNLIVQVQRIRHSHGDTAPAPARESAPESAPAADATPSDGPDDPIPF